MPGHHPGKPRRITVDELMRYVVRENEGDEARAALKRFREIEANNGLPVITTTGYRQYSVTDELDLPKWITER